MGKLSILGAQRVKALTEILAEKEKEALSKLVIPTYEEIKEIVDKEFNVDKLQSDLIKAVDKANKSAKELQLVTGYDIRITKTQYSSNSKTEYSKRISKLQEVLVDSKRAEIRSEFKSKKQMLWLCETLEEAKEIVGI